MEETQLAEYIKKVQKEIVLEIDRLCRENGIRYFLAYGTLIGAMRHDGFIPWDDDIDIMMPYNDLLKFAQICKTELNKEKFFFQSPTTDPAYRLAIFRLRRNDSIMVEKRQLGKNIHHGIFVDIYPLFGASKTKVGKLVQVFRAMKRSLYLLQEPVLNHGKIMKLGSATLLRLKGKKGCEKAQKRLLAKLVKYDYDKAQKVCVLDSGIKEMSTDYDKNWFGNGVLHKFDELTLVVPDDADKVLTKYYGDYMQLPPISEQKVHHEFLQIVLPPEYYEGENE